MPDRTRALTVYVNHCRLTYRWIDECLQRLHLREWWILLENHPGVELFVPSHPGGGDPLASPKHSAVTPGLSMVTGTVTCFSYVATPEIEAGWPATSRLVTVSCRNAVLPLS